MAKATSSAEKHRISAARELLDMKMSEIVANSYEKKFRAPSFEDVVKELKESEEFEITGISPKEARVKKGVDVLDLSNVEAILVCSKKYEDIIFRIGFDLKIELERVEGGNTISEEEPTPVPEPEPEPEPQPNLTELTQENVIELKLISKENNGEIIKITDKTEKDYYEIEYQIGGISGEWTKIESGESVLVPYGSIIYARLAYENQRGEHASLTTASTITITYIGNGGKLANNAESKTVTVTINSKITLPSNEFSYTMHDFVAWTDESENDHQPGTEYTVGHSDISFEAKWENKISEELTCMMTTGNQYVHTGVQVNQDTTVEMKCQVLKVGNQFLYGVRKNINSNDDRRFGSLFELDEYYNGGELHQQKGFRLDYANDAVHLNNNQYSGTHIIKQAKNKFYIDNQLICTSEYKEFSNNETGNDLILFNTNTNGSVDNSMCAEMKFYYCKIWSGDILVRDYVPVVDNTGKICLHDKVQNKLYYASYGNKQEEFMKEKEMTQVTYAQSNGTQYISTGLKANSNTTLEIKCSLNEVTNQFLYGGRTTNKLNTYAGVVQVDQLRFDYNTTHTVRNTLTKDTIYTIKHAKNIFYLNGTEVGRTDAGTFDCEYNLYLFSCNTQTSPTLNASMKLYYCKIWDGNTLVRDYIPVISHTGRCCLYDKVEQKYYYGIGGDFVAGQ